jgi:hypothetical protein
MFFSRLLAGFLLLACLMGPSYRTDNFVVFAPTAEAAEKVAKAAEAERERVAKYWFEKSLPAWSIPCYFHIFENTGRVEGDLRMRPGAVDADIFAYGSLERIVYDLTPHEVCHVILYLKNGCNALPKWLDEGAAMAMESETSRTAKLFEAYVLVDSKKVMTLPQLFAISRTPFTEDERYIFYCQSAGFAAWILRDGPEQYLKLISSGNQCRDAAFVSRMLGYESVEACEEAWRLWMLGGGYAQRRPAVLLVQQ